MRSPPPRRPRARPPELVVPLRLAWPTGVPPSAPFTELGRDDWYLWGHFRYPRGAARITWHLSGSIHEELHFDPEGRRHGLEINRYPDGTVLWQVPWVHGSMHGLARNFDRHGEEVARARFVHGTGLDVWGEDEIGELRELVGGERHGVERWGHPRYPSEESYFLGGKLAGIVRHFTGPALEDGYPKFYLDDEEVSRARYLRARRRRPELVPYRPEDDRRERPLLPALRRIWLRADLRARLLQLPDPADP